MEEFRYELTNFPQAGRISREELIVRILAWQDFRVLYFREGDEAPFDQVEVQLDHCSAPFHCRLFRPDRQLLQALSVVDWLNISNIHNTATALLGAIESLLQQHAEELASGK